MMMRECLCFLGAIGKPASIRSGSAAFELREGPIIVTPLPD